MVQRSVNKFVHVRGRGRMALTRRNAIIATGACLAVPPVKIPASRSHTIELSEEAVAIAQDLVDRGCYRTIQEAVAAAIDAMMARDRRERLTWREELVPTAREWPDKSLAPTS